MSGKSTNNRQKFADNDDMGTNSGGFTNMLRATDLTFLSHGLRGPALPPSARACQTFVEAKTLRGPNHSVLCY